MHNLTPKNASSELTGACLPGQRVDADVHDYAVRQAIDDMRRTRCQRQTRELSDARPGARIAGSTDATSAIATYGVAHEIGPAHHPTHQKLSLYAEADPKDRPGAFPGASDA